MKIILAAVLLSTSAFAAEAPVKPELPKSDMTIDECLVVLSGLESLDGYQTVVNEGKPNVQVVNRSYVFGNGVLRADIAHDITALRDVRKAAQESQQGIFKEVAKGAPDIPQTVAGADGKEHPNPLYAEYIRQLNQATGKPCSAIPTHISIKDLKLETNEIPGSVLSALDKMLDK